MVKSRTARDVLTGTWGAASCAMRGDWDGFDLLMRESATDSDHAVYWSVAAVGGAVAILRSLDVSDDQLLDISQTYFSKAVAASLQDRQVSVSDLVASEIQQHGAEAVVGEAILQLCMAISLLAESREMDGEKLLNRLCLMVATVAEDGPTL